MGTATSSSTWTEASLVCISLTITIPAYKSSGLGGALRARSASGLWGPAAPLGPVVAPLVPRCALLPAPTPRVRAIRARNGVHAHALSPKPLALLHRNRQAWGNSQTGEAPSNGGAW